MEIEKVEKQQQKTNRIFKAAPHPLTNFETQKIVLDLLILCLQERLLQIFLIFFQQITLQKMMI